MTKHRKPDDPDALLSEHDWERKRFGVSRQRLQQIRWRDAGLCPRCGGKRESGKSKCRPCLDRDCKAQIAWAKKQRQTGRQTVGTR
jgi:hypothetical protein